MTVETRGDALIITELPVEQMALLSLGLALGEGERRVLRALLEGRRVYVREEGLEYKRYCRTAPQGVYVRCTAMERQLRELGVVKLRKGCEPR